MKGYRMLILASVLAVLSCTGGKKENPETTTSTEESNAYPLQNADLYSDGKTSLIKIANYRFEVRSVKEGAEAIEKAIRKYPAYVSSSSTALHNPTLENKVSIRIASDYFNDLLKDLDREAVFVNFRNVTSDDVSKEFVDLESRLRTKREVENRYRDILQKKAGTIKDVLEAERVIEMLHEDIEAAVSRTNFLREQIKYSTINVEYYQTISESYSGARTENFKQRIVAASSAGLNGLTSVLIAMLYLWPLIIVTMAAFGIYYVRKHANIRV